MPRRQVAETTNYVSARGVGDALAAPKPRLALVATFAD